MNKVKSYLSPQPFKLWQVLTVSCIIVYVTVSIIYIFYGELNADEGWYLYAGKLVYAGNTPYIDFAFTQTPLLPYVYGFFQNFGSSPLFMGRIISVLFSSVALIFSIQTANKINGPVAGALTASLWATFTYGIYYQSITKTYALLLFCMSVAIYLLVTNKDNNKSFIFISALVLLASLTRLSALFFAIPILTFVFIEGTKTTKLAITILCVVSIVLFGALTLPNWPSAYWNIILHHTNQWGDISNAEKAISILFRRVPLLFLAFPTYAALLIVILGFNFKTFLTFLQKNRITQLILLSLIMFAVPNLASGGFHSEYFVPLLFLLSPILSCVIIAIWPTQSKASRIALQVILLSTFILGFLRGGQSYIDISGGKLPIREVQELANLVQTQSDSNDLIFAFEGLWVAVEADRFTLPNMAMAQFSYFDGVSSEAVKYHLINDEMILEALQNQEPSVLILTKTDWDLLASSEVFEELQKTILANYVLVISQDNFGQTQDNVKLYFRVQP
ncbi:MAG: glycosyltransferase family 39 protein [Anaerolineales bacterium]|nr:glycosyltransferase family 39 protein [Anaerolineales bacterium]